MHLYHQPLPVLMEMEVEAVMSWGKDAQALFKFIHGNHACPFMVKT